MPQQQTGLPFYLWNRDGTWYYRLRHEKTFHTTGLRADSKLSRRRAEQWVHANIQLGRQTDSTFRQYAHRYHVWDKCPRIRRMHDEGKRIGREHTAHLRSTLERFVFTDWFADLQMSAIRRRDVLDLRGRVMAATTPKVTNTTIVAVRTIFAEALYREDIEMNPCAGVTTVKEESRRRPLIPINGLRQMFQDCPGVFPDVTTYAAYNLAARTGMRRSEVLALQWESVSCDTRTVSVQSAWTNSFRQLGPTKTGNGRLLPVGEGVLQPLRLMLEDRVRVHADDFLFCDDTNGRPYHSHRWANGFRAALQAVGLDLAITPHSLRHSLNSHLLAAGVDAAKVRAYMGWSDRGAVLSPVQAGYTHWTDDALRDVADAVERLFAG